MEDAVVLVYRDDRVWREPVFVAASVISRAPRPCVAKLNDQRMRTRTRFWKPMRYQRWTTSQVIQATKPLSLQPFDVGDGGRAADRREVALVAVAERRRLAGA